MHLAPLIRDLAVILAIAGFMTILFQRIRQPVVLGYIIAGILIGPYTPPFQLVRDIPSIQTWAELGVIFLMFSLGLEFSFRKLIRVGGSSAITASAEVFFFVPTGYLVGKLLGWSSVDSLFLGAMLSISSTTIIIKALDELKLKRHRFAELIFGALIVEDLFAILLLVALGTVAVSKSLSIVALSMATLKLILVVGGWFITGYFVVPRLMRYVGRIGNDEMLTILSLGLCLALVVFANHFHYSTALGAFIMGSIIAESPVLHRVEHNIASLRDLFGAIFFVSIGMLIDPRVLWEYKGTIALLCVFTVTGKILSTGLGALISGQSLRNSIQVGFGLAQIGEFSFIIAQLGLTLKVTSDFIYPIAVAVSLVTTFTTPYLIRISGRAAIAIEGWLPEKIRKAINKYAAYAEAKRTGTHARDQKAALRPLLRWSLNGLTASVIFVLCSEWGLPILNKHFSLSGDTAPLIGWLAAIALSSPFIWAMLTAFRVDPSQARGKPNRSQIFRAFSKLSTFFLIETLSAEFFPVHYILFVTVAALVIALAVFYHRLEASYRWFEERFLSTFEPENDDSRPHSSFNHLVPWDAHLVTMEVHPNSKLVMKRISEAALRVRYGVNIVAIQRGRNSIVTPLPHEVLLPKDQLILLGTDDQVELVKTELEDSHELSHSPPAAARYELRQTQLTSTSPFVGKSIRQSGIREHFRAMVVGLEREGKRNINPDSDLTLFENDVLWIAGEKAMLESLIAMLRVSG